jgi:hypothetical protein
MGQVPLDLPAQRRIGVEQPRKKGITDHRLASRSRVALGSRRTIKS